MYKNLQIYYKGDVTTQMLISFISITSYEAINEEILPQAKFCFIKITLEDQFNSQQDALKTLNLSFIKGLGSLFQFLALQSVKLISTINTVLHNANFARYKASFRSQQRWFIKLKKSVQGVIYKARVSSQHVFLYCISTFSN